MQGVAGASPIGPGAARLRARRGLRDQRGLSSTEYVIILIVVALVGIAAWRVFGDSARDRAASASSEVGGLDQTAQGPRGGGIRVARTSSSALDEATADATPPPTDEERWATPAFMLGFAAVLVLAVVARRMRNRGGGGGASGDGAAPAG